MKVSEAVSKVTKDLVINLRDLDYNRYKILCLKFLGKFLINFLF